MVLRAGGRARERGQRLSTERAAGLLLLTRAGPGQPPPDPCSQGAEVTWSSTPAGDALTARVSQWWHVQ